MTVEGQRAIKAVLNIMNEFGEVVGKFFTLRFSSFIQEIHLALAFLLSFIDVYVAIYFKERH